jgi:hypothetical protein
MTSVGRNRLSPLRSWVPFSLWTLMWKESVNTQLKVVGFLRVLRFPPTVNVDRVSWDYSLNDPSTVAVLHDETWVIRWLPEAPLESLRLDQVELRPSYFSLTLPLLHAQIHWARCLTGLNNVLFTVVNNIEQCCWAWIGCNNIVQYCWQLWTMWAAKYCSILFSSILENLIVFSRTVKVGTKPFYEVVSCVNVLLPDKEPLLDTSWCV